MVTSSPVEIEVCKIPEDNSYCTQAVVERICMHIQLIQQAGMPTLQHESGSTCQLHQKPGACFKKPRSGPVSHKTSVVAKQVTAS